MLKAEQLPVTKSPRTPNCHLLQWLLAKCKHGPVPQHDCEPELFPCAFFVLGQKFGPWQAAGRQICRKQVFGVSVFVHTFTECWKKWPYCGLVPLAALLQGKPSKSERVKLLNRALGSVSEDMAQDCCASSLSLRGFEGAKAHALVF